MTRRKRRKSIPLPILGAQMMLASWETIARRSLMVAQGTCSPTEYTDMLLEKMQAAQESSLALALPWTAGTANAVFAPWHRRATGNARRLRRR